MPQTAEIDKYEETKQELILQLDAYHRRWNKDLLSDAYDFSRQMHQDQWRQSGEPFFEHPIAVAKILTEMKTDYIAVTAGLLHDVVEDSSVAIEEIEERFGKEVAAIVAGVTKFSDERFPSYQERYSATIRKMLLSMMGDLRVILIKLADRLHNMRTIDALNAKSQERIARETRDVYAALAHRFGIARLGRELEDLSLRVLDREGYDKISKAIEGTQESRQEMLSEIIEPIQHELDASGLQADVRGRVKSISSIYNKIQKQGRALDEIYDLFAIRIIVQNNSECYRALGIVHDLYTPVIEHFTDYIALPKSNLYQSLHTKVRDYKRRLIEIQIRTEEMHAVAEIGIAAHYRYKEGHMQPDELDDHFKWIRNLMDSHQEEIESGELLENLKVDLFRDEIFVFTPKGRLIQLPRGATPIDFAFSIHSDIGLKSIGAKVGGKVVSLNYQLESGDQVEILTSTKQKPSAEWLKSIRTSKARSRIKKWFRETRFDQSVKLGHEMIENELKRLKMSPNPGDIEEVALSFGHLDENDFFADVGNGDIPIGQVMQKLLPKVAADKDTLISKIVQKVSKNNPKVRVSGFEQLVITIADCCSPLPGDPIIGFQSPGKGVVIHRTDCNKVADLLEDEQKVVSVGWDVEREDRFRTWLHIIADDRPNLLNEVTAALTGLKINIHTIEMHMEDNLAVGRMQIEVRNLPHLTKLISRLNRIRGVLKAERQEVDSVDDID